MINRDVVNTGDLEENLLHFIRQYSENLRISEQDRLLQVSSYGFDAAVMDIFGALLNGAALYPVGNAVVDATARDRFEFAELEQEPTIANVARVTRLGLDELAIECAEKCIAGTDYAGSDARAVAMSEDGTLDVVYDGRPVLDDPGPERLGAGPSGAAPRPGAPRRPASADPPPAEGAGPAPRAPGTDA